MKHVFKTTLTNGSTVSNAFDVPTDTDVFDVDAWRASGLFNTGDDVNVIGRKIAEHVASNVTIAVQRAIRKHAGSQDDADAIVAGFRVTRSVAVRTVPRALYDTFTKEQIAFMEKDGTMLVPVDEK